MRGRLQFNKDYKWDFDDLVPAIESWIEEEGHIQKKLILQALYAICSEIHDVKEDMERLDNEFRGYDP